MSSDTYEIEEREGNVTSWRYRAGRFECEWGKEMHVDVMTECKRCGAWYEYDDEQTVMVQTAPPQFEVDRDGE